MCCSRRENGDPAPDDASALVVFFEGVVKLIGAIAYTLW
jgi:hypothetical protein